MPQTSTIEYRGYEIEQTVVISRSPRFDNLVSHQIKLHGQVVNSSAATMLEAVRWIDRAVRAANNAR